LNRSDFFDAWHKNRLDSNRLFAGDVQFPSIGELVIGCLTLCQRSRAPNIANIGVSLWVQIFDLLESDVISFTSEAREGLKRKKGKRRDRSFAATTQTKVAKDQDLGWER